MRAALITIAVVALVGIGATGAHAQEGTSNTGVGVGIEALLLAPPGVAASYDADAWRLDGMVAFSDGQQQLMIGGRVLFPVHASDRADFSIGGGLGIVNYDNGGNNNNNTDIHIEGDAQIRAFIVPNVALTATLGVAVVVGDGDDFAVTGQLMGSLGVMYYFY